MKNIQKILIIIFFILFSNIEVFAESGFEAVFNIPLGASVGIFNGEIETVGTAPKISTEAGFDFGIIVQLGYMFSFENLGLSILGELGYSYDSYGFSVSHTISAFGMTEDFKVYNSLYFHSFQIGFIPKFNLWNFALGIGGGVKIPFAGAYEIKKVNTINIAGNSSVSEENLKRNHNSSFYSSYVIPYLKVTFDYSFFFADNIAFNLGAYLGYDIGLTDKNTKYRVDSFDIGVQLGLRFAPRLNI